MQGQGAERSGRRRRRPAPAPAAEALYSKAKLELDNKAYAEAVDDFTRATTSASDPELRANAWLGLGAAYGELGYHTRAVAAYEQVTVLRPDDADAWRVLAEGMGLPPASAIPTGGRARARDRARRR